MDNVEPKQNKIDRLKKVYLDKKYPGDLSEMIDGLEIAKTQNAANKRNRALAIWVVAALLLVAATIGGFQLLDWGRGGAVLSGTEKDDANTPVVSNRKRQPKLFSLANRVQWTFANSPSDVAMKTSTPSVNKNPRISTTKLTLDSVSKPKAKTPEKKRRISIWQIVSKNGLTPMPKPSLQLGPRPKTNSQSNRLLGTPGSKPKTQKANLKSKSKPKPKSGLQRKDRIQSNRRFTIRRT